MGFSTTTSLRSSYSGTMYGNIYYNSKIWGICIDFFTYNLQYSFIYIVLENSSLIAFVRVRETKWISITIYSSHIFVFCIMHYGLDTFSVYVLVDIANPGYALYCRVYSDIGILHLSHQTTRSELTVYIYSMHGFFFIKNRLDIKI